MDGNFERDTNELPARYFALNSPELIQAANDYVEQYFTAEETRAEFLRKHEAFGFMHVGTTDGVLFAGQPKGAGWRESGHDMGLYVPDVDTVDGQRIAVQMRQRAMQYPCAGLVATMMGLRPNVTHNGGVDAPVIELMNDQFYMVVPPRVGLGYVPRDGADELSVEDYADARTKASVAHDSALAAQAVAAPLQSRRVASRPS